MILGQGFEVLDICKGTEKIDMDCLLEESRILATKWVDNIVINENKPNFYMDEEMKFHYITEKGEHRCADITEYAFAQLCTRVGIPANYIKKCFENNKRELAVLNFKTWASDGASNMLIRESEGVVRAVLSDKYVPYDSYKALKTLRIAVNTKRWNPTQVYLSEDRLAVRYVDFENPLQVNEGMNSKLYTGISVTNSDVGRGSLKMKVMLYRFACKNGMLIASNGGTLYKQTHIGEKMKDGKIRKISEAIGQVDTIKKDIKIQIEKSRRILNPFEYDVCLNKAKRELKLSEKSVEKLNNLVGETYERTNWGFMNGITELAQDFSLETRMEMEGFAGDLLMQKKFI